MLTQMTFRLWDILENRAIVIRHLGFWEDGELWYLQAEDEYGDMIDPPYFEDTLGKEWALMPWTGKEDTQGVKIWKDSIVKIENHPFQKRESSDVGIKIEDTYVISWNEEEMTWCAGKFLLSRVLPYVRVIGNIYENSELLEESE